MASKRKVVIFGTSGHASVCLDILQLQGYTVVGFVTQDETLVGLKNYQIPVIAVDEHADLLEKIRSNEWDYFIGIGDNVRRDGVTHELTKKTSRKPVQAIHPNAVVSRYATLDVGVFVNCGAVVNAGAQVGSGVILNTSSTVDHDCRVADFAQLAPGVHLGSKSIVEEGALLGLGAVVLPGKKVGKRAIVGAGAAVIGDIPAGATAVGVPAKTIKKI